MSNLSHCWVIYDQVEAGATTGNTFSWLITGLISHICIKQAQNICNSSLIAFAFAVSNATDFRNSFRKQAGERSKAGVGLLGHLEVLERTQKLTAICDRRHAFGAQQAAKQPHKTNSTIQIGKSSISFSKTHCERHSAATKHQQVCALHISGTDFINSET